MCNTNSTVEDICQIQVRFIEEEYLLTELTVLSSRLMYHKCANSKIAPDMNLSFSLTIADLYQNKIGEVRKEIVLRLVGTSPYRKSVLLFPFQYEYSVHSKTKLQTSTRITIGSRNFLMIKGYKVSYCVYTKGLAATCNSVAVVVCCVIIAQFLLDSTATTWKLTFSTT
uniref:Uncharacterized protein n=1 Tax=Glossina austeni TaxID=7395 RepID=A0A1A9VTD5_GLOAU